MQALDKYLPSKDSKVLNPGCGLGRLSFEIASKGYASIGIEFSYQMIFVSEFLLGKNDMEKKFSIFPWISCSNNIDLYEDQFQCYQILDIGASDIPENLNLQFKSGDFLEIEKMECEYEAVVTCFFIDTNQNILDYLVKIFSILKHGGIWINLGPLKYHFSQTPNEVSIELSWEEVLFACKKIGFEVLEVSTHQTHYNWNPKSM